MRLRNPFDVPPIRPAPAPGQVDPTGELGTAKPDPLADSDHAPPAPAGEPVKVEFAGDAAEFARLWYVNLLCTLLSLGLYSPWAKVSVARYIASRTLVGGVPLCYHGKPFPILKGRLAAAAILLLAFAAYTALPVLKPVLILAAILIAPWFLVQTFRFRARNYSFRGLRFDFQARYAMAYLAVLPLAAWPAMEIASRVLGGWLPGAAAALGEVLLPFILFTFLFPLAMAAFTRLRLEGMRYGSARFALDATARDFYKVYWRSVGPVALGILSLAAVVVVTIQALTNDSDVAFLTQAAAFAAAGSMGLGYSRARRFNLSAHRLVVNGRIRFRCTLEPKALAYLYLRNAAWIMATLGLAIPWRRIRTLSLRASHVTVYVDGGFGAIHRKHAATPGAFGEELAEGLQLELSL
jgi:uncharacterized membrane protein YjgN (DUF898 family)